MKKAAVIFCVLFGLFDLTSVLHAQIIPNVQQQNIDPTKWTYEVKKLDRNEYELIFRVELEKGWHIFSQDPGDEMLIPPTFTFDENKRVKLTGMMEEKGKLTETEFEGFDNKLRYFEGEAEFIQKITYEGESTTITGEHRYQICNDNMCLPPATKKFEFVMKK